MQEWVDRAVERIAAYKPQRVLEIGFGAGLVLFRLAPLCQAYIGTDISSKAIEYIERHLDFLTARPAEFDLHHLRADDLDGLQPASFDCVVLNSVIQYFPSAKYLRKVLECATRLVRPGGILFIGDVRHLQLLEAFHASVAISRAVETASVGSLLQAVRRGIGLEKELLLSPDFFVEFAGQVSNISHIEVMPKRSRFNNELARFRYDVVLHVQGSRPEPWVGPWLGWQPEKLTLDNLRQRLEKQPERLGLLRVPNARTAADAALWGMLTEARLHRTAKDLRQAAGKASEASVDPEELAILGESLGYRVDFSWADSDPVGCFDVLFSRAGCERIAFPSSRRDVAKPVHTFANVPNQAALTARLLPELRSHLAGQLPDYMIPSAFVFLTALPLSGNGKVDRQALPAPLEERPDLEAGFVAPRNSTKSALARIWGQLLKLDQVGINDNFFALGGDSILSIQIVARANQAGLQISAKDILQHQTIAGLAASAGGKVFHTEQGLVTGPVPLTPIQHWFFELQLPDPHHFNQSVVREVKQAINVDLLERAFGHLLEQHDALRMRFTRHESEWQQFNCDLEASQVKVIREDLSALTSEEQFQAFESRATQLQTSFDLGQPPLIRVAWFERGSDLPPWLLIVVHHLLIDAVSWPVLFEDLWKVHRLLQQGEAMKLPRKTTSFKHWADQLAEFARSNAMAAEREYWSRLSRIDIPPLPVDFPEGMNTRDSSAVVVANLGDDETQALLQEVATARQVQTNDALLTALASAFQTWTGQPRLLLSLEGHGREDILPGIDLSRTVGWFTTLYPVLLDLGDAARPADAMLSVRDQLRAIPNHGIGFGLLRYLGDAEIQNLLRPIPTGEVSFNYFGQRNKNVRAETPKAPTVPSAGPWQGESGLRTRAHGDNCHHHARPP